MTTGALAIQDNDTVNQYVSVGESSFVYNFPILEADELKVSRDQVLLTYGVDYTINGIGDDGGGTIDLLTGASTPGDIWTLWQDMPIERLTGFSPGAATLLGEALNAEFAARLRVEQQLRREIRNSIRLAPDDPVSGQDMVLPLNESRRGKFLAFDALGAPIPATGLGSDPDLRTDLAIVLPGSDGARLIGYRRDSPGTVARSAASKFDEVVSVLDWGTDQAALQAAATYCASTGAFLVGAPITITLTSTVTINCQGDLSMLTVQGNSGAFAAGTPLVRTGTTSGGPLQILGQRLALPKIINTGKPGIGWAAQQVACELANLYSAEVYVPYIFGFAVGLDCGGYNSGFSYNNVYLGEIRNNKIGVRLLSKPGNGWANQNTFHGGRIWIPSTEGVGIVGARFIQFAPFDVAVTAGNGWPNSNVFIGTSIEGNEPEYLLELAGSHNQFINCRYESLAPKVLLTGHAVGVDTYENLFIGGYNVSQIVFTVSGIERYNSIINSRVSTLTGSDVVMNMNNHSSGASPLIQGFAPGVNALNKTAAATDWGMRLATTQLQGKQTADAQPRFEIDFQNGVIKTGFGGVAPSQVVSKRQTGYAAMTGAANTGTVYDVAAVTLPQLAGRVKALQDALTTHGLIGV